jgi:DNA-binding transcriptional regulator YhcF (GntR family)
MLRLLKHPLLTHKLTQLRREETTTKVSAYWEGIVEVEQNEDSLAIIDTQLSTDRVSAGDPVDAAVTVLNNGLTDEENVKVRVSLGTSEASVAIPMLQEGQEQTVYMTLQLPKDLPTGIQTIKAQLEKTKDINDKKFGKLMQEIKKMIYYNMLAPGQKLVYQDLARRLNMSITPVIQALNGLKRSNFVRYEANKGYFVGEINETEARELYEAREALESYLIPCVIKNLKREDLDAIVEIDERVLGEKRKNYWERKLAIMNYKSSQISLVAEVEGIPLITSDERLYRAVKKEIAWVKWLGNL